MSVSETSQSPTRGFLFADLRSYSAFVERHGDEAAVELLTAYRSLVRTEVNQHEGAEIRTEGDSFYVVFPSASGAVRCGISILNAVDANNEKAVGHPLRVGIGVHAGETADSPEGFVGSAVNIAARVCAVARPGELLTTETVRSLIRTRIQLQFVSRGSHRLKGMAEPIALYSVVRGSRVERVGFAALAGSTLTRVSRHRSVAVGALGIGLSLLAAAGLVVFLASQRVPRLDSASGESVSPPAHRVSAPSSEPDPSVTAIDQTFPNIAELRLLSRIDPTVGRHCARADPADAPTFLFSAQVGGAGEPAKITREPLSVDAGLRCSIRGSAEPDVVSYWDAKSGADIEVPFFNIVSTRHIEPGDCGEVTRAHSRWEFGGDEGLILCSAFGGEALLVWTYADEDVIAEATRDDGDVVALYRWWREHGRLLGS